jgi:acyl-coenzyme A thioesterase PaaI-like protein
MRVVMSDIPSGFTRLEWASPFHELVGPFYEKRDRATLIIGMPVAKKHINRRGAVHGGMICTLVDFAMGQAAGGNPWLTVSGTIVCVLSHSANAGRYIEQSPPTFEHCRSLHQPVRGC